MAIRTLQHIISLGATGARHFLKHVKDDVSNVRFDKELAKAIQIDHHNKTGFSLTATSKERNAEAIRLFEEMVSGGNVNRNLFKGIDENTINKVWKSGTPKDEQRDAMAWIKMQVPEVSWSNYIGAQAGISKTTVERLIKGKKGVGVKGFYKGKDGKETLVYKYDPDPNKLLSNLKEGRGPETSPIWKTDPDTAKFFSKRFVKGEKEIKRGTPTNPLYTEWKDTLNHLSQASAYEKIATAGTSLQGLRTFKGTKFSSGIKGAGAVSLPGRMEQALWRSFLKGNPKVQVWHKNPDGSKVLIDKTTHKVGIPPGHSRKKDVAVFYDKNGNPVQINRGGYRLTDEGDNTLEGFKTGKQRDYTIEQIRNDQLITDANKYPEFQEFIGTQKQADKINGKLVNHPGGKLSPNSKKYQDLSKQLENNEISLAEFDQAVDLTHKTPAARAASGKEQLKVPLRDVLSDAGLQPNALDHLDGVAINPLKNTRVMDARTNAAQGQIKQGAGLSKSDEMQALYSPDNVAAMEKKIGYEYTKYPDELLRDNLNLATDILVKGRQLRVAPHIAQESVAKAVTYRTSSGGKKVFRQGDNLADLTKAEKLDLQTSMGRDKVGRPFVDEFGNILRKDPFDFVEGGRVNKLAMGGIAKDKDPREFSIEDLDSKVGTLQSMLAGIGSGLLDIPKGAFTLGAALMDMGFGTNNAAKVEKYFDDLTTFDEKAEATFAGNLTKIMINLGVPGGFAFKAGSSLATKAMLAKRHGNYFRLTDPKLVDRYKTALNGRGRLFATLGGAGATGVSDMIFVGDPEHVGTIGDMFGGPTQLKPNDSDSASREVANRMKFGLDTSLLVGAVGGLGSSIKSLVRRGNELESNNTAIDKFLSYIRPRGKKTQEYFDIERESLGLRRGDINYASEVSRKLDKHIDRIFPFVKNPFNKLGNKGRREFMDDLNETLLSGDFNINAATGRAEFGNMNKGMVEKITKMMRDKGGKSEDIQGVMDSFYDIRLGWGHMFSRLGGAMDKEALKEFAPLFGKKLKDYLGSTYEIFQNKSLIPLLNYKPSSEAVEKMVKLFKSSATEKGVKLTDEEARHYVDKLVETARPAREIATKAERTSGVYFDAPDFFVNKTTLHDLEVAPRTLPLEALNKEAKPVVEELLGKISDPLQTVLAGTGKLSMITRRNQFFQTLKSADDNLTMKRKEFIAKNPGVELPPELRGMFRETELEAINELGKNIKKIEIDPRRVEEAGITNPLDGLYAEKGVAEAIESSSMIAKDKSTLKQLYDSFILYPKATSQMAKTILSPITHARNFISAGAFATANGLIPGITISPSDTAKAWKEAYKALQIPGARMANDRYRELLRLGVVNTNVRLGDLQKLLKDVDFGESWGSRKAMRGMMRQLSKTKKWTEDLYTAEDDFWKISSFALERTRLKNAYSKYGMKFTDDLLDKEAADIVKNNIPNYDMVNGFIKDLRQLPFGNFVSFPAEIYRTSFNIMNRALKEINLTHTLDDGRIVKPLRNIGMQRMFGLATTVVAMPYGTVEAAKAIYDVTEDEMQALRRFVPEWSKNSTLVPIRGDDGEMKYVDFSHANAYDTMIRPITTLMNGVQQGIEEDQIFKNVFTSMIDATKETASPFVSESIWTEALMDVSPIAGRGGRTREGRRLWTDETPWGDAFAAGIKHLGSTMVPGSGPAFNRMRLALTEEVDEYGRTYEFDDEFAGVFGFRAVEVDPLNSMKFKIADFRTGINDSRREFTGPLLRGGPITPEQVIDQYEIANQSLFRVQQEMFKDYYAARILGVSDKALSNTFQDRVSNKQVRAIRTGRFTPFIPSENIEQAFKDNARAIGEPDAYRIAKDNIRRLIKQYSKLRLGEEFPTLENPFRTSFDQPSPQTYNAFTPPLDNQSLSSVPNMLPGTNQQATMQRGQQVFGPTDTVFGA